MNNIKTLYIILNHNDREIKEFKRIDFAIKYMKKFNYKKMIKRRKTFIPDVEAFN